MPNPSYKGQAGGWKRTKGMRVENGADDRQTLRVPYEGPQSGVAAFLANWQRGDACPVAGFTYLKLAQRPSITVDGPMGRAVLVFDGADPNSGSTPGKTAPEKEEFLERHSFAYSSSSTSNSAYYSYDATVIEVRYTSTSKVTTTSFDSDGAALDDPEPLLKEAGGGADALEASALVKDADYRVVEIHGIRRQRFNGSSYEVEEYHAKYLEQMP